MDQIADYAERLRPDALAGQIGGVYAVSLAPDMTVLEGVWQTLRLAIPPVDPKSRTARLWRDRCADLRRSQWTMSINSGRPRSAFASCVSVGTAPGADVPPSSVTVMNGGAERCLNPWRLTGISPIVNKMRKNRSTGSSDGQKSS